MEDHKCGEDSLASAILKYLCVPLDCWPRELVWRCPRCKGTQPSAVRICSTCSTNSTRSSALHQLLLSLSNNLSMQCPETPHAPDLFLEMDDLVGIQLSPHGNRMSGLTVDAYKIKAARSCICVEMEEGEAPALSTDYNANSLPSYFNLLDDDLLGAAERSDSEADPCLLDTSSESMGSSRIARIEHDLAFMSVSPRWGPRRCQLPSIHSKPR
jgi:hypothetical protein